MSTHNPSRLSLEDLCKACPAIQQNERVFGSEKYVLLNTEESIEYFSDNGWIPYETGYMQHTKKKIDFIFSTARSHGAHYVKLYHPDRLAPNGYYSMLLINSHNTRKKFTIYLSFFRSCSKSYLVLGQSYVHLQVHRGVEAVNHAAALVAVQSFLDNALGHIDELKKTVLSQTDRESYIRDVCTKRALYGVSKDRRASGEFRNTEKQFQNTLDFVELKFIDREPSIWELMIEVQRRLIDNGTIGIKGGFQVLKFGYQNLAINQYIWRKALTYANIDVGADEDESDDLEGDEEEGGEPAAGDEVNEVDDAASKTLQEFFEQDKRIKTEPLFEKTGYELTDKLTEFLVYYKDIMSDAPVNGSVFKYIQQEFDLKGRDAQFFYNLMTNNAE